MFRLSLSVLAAAIVWGVIVPVAFAGQPDPGLCYGDEHVGVSPKNNSVPPSAQYVYAFFLLDGAGVPVAGFPASQVELDFSACNEPSTRPLNQIPADGDSGIGGRMEWRINLGFGGADPCHVDVLVFNQVFWTIEGTSTEPCGGLRSPDVNGDGLVALADLSIWQQAFVTGGPPFAGDLAGNFDCLTALADLSVWQQHFIAP